MTTATLENTTAQAARSQETGSLQNNTQATARKTAVVVPRHRFDREDDALVFTALLPGVVPEDLDIQVENERVSLKARSQDLQFEGYRKVYTEFSNTHYEANFKVPNDYDGAAIQAKLDLGVLRLTLPKRESAKPIRIQVVGS